MIKNKRMSYLSPKSKKRNEILNAAAEWMRPSKSPKSSRMYYPSSWQPTSPWWRAPQLTDRQELAVELLHQSPSTVLSHKSRTRWRRWSIETMLSAQKRTSHRACQKIRWEQLTPRIWMRCRWCQSTISICWSRLRIVELVYGLQGSSTKLEAILAEEGRQTRIAWSPAPNTRSQRLKTLSPMALHPWPSVNIKRQPSPATRPKASWRVSAPTCLAIQVVKARLEVNHRLPLVPLLVIQGCLSQLLMVNFRQRERNQPIKRLLRTQILWTSSRRTNKMLASITAASQPMTRERRIWRQGRIRQRCRRIKAAGTPARIRQMLTSWWSQRHQMLWTRKSRDQAPTKSMYYLSWEAAQSPADNYWRPRE